MSWFRLLFDWPKVIHLPTDETETIDDSGDDLHDEQQFGIGIDYHVPVGKFESYIDSFGNYQEGNFEIGSYQVSTDVRYSYCAICDVYVYNRNAVMQDHVAMHDFVTGYLLEKGPYSNGLTVKYKAFKRRNAGGAVLIDPETGEPIYVWRPYTTASTGRATKTLNGFKEVFRETMMLVPELGCGLHCPRSCECWEDRHPNVMAEYETPIGPKGNTDMKEDCSCLSCDVVKLTSKEELQQERETEAARRVDVIKPFQGLGRYPIDGHDCSKCGTVLAVEGICYTLERPEYGSTCVDEKGNFYRHIGTKEKLVGLDKENLQNKTLVETRVMDNPLCMPASVWNIVTVYEPKSNWVRIARDTYNGVADKVFSVTLKDKLVPFTLREPNVGEFRPLHRYYAPAGGSTEHLVTTSGEFEAVLKVDDRKHIVEIHVNGKPVDEIFLPINHTFFTHVRVEVPASEVL